MKLDFMWLNSPKVIIASTKQNINNTYKYHMNLYNISDAVRPADHSTLVTVEIDKSGSVAFAVGVEDPKSNSVVIPDESNIILLLLRV
jgi:hypothetical protein